MSMGVYICLEYIYTFIGTFIGVYILVWASAFLETGSSLEDIVKSDGIFFT